MKKYFAFFLLLSVTALVYGRPQKLVIKTDKESVELRYGLWNSCLFIAYIHLSLLLAGR